MFLSEQKMWISYHEWGNEQKGKVFYLFSPFVTLESKKISTILEKKEQQQTYHHMCCFHVQIDLSTHFDLRLLSHQLCITFFKALETIRDCNVQKILYVFISYEINYPNGKS